MKTHYFVSDLHLGGGDDSRRQARFVHFLESQQARAAGLYILGDLFEFGFEYSGRMPRGSEPILDQLAKWRAGGARVVLVKGNHDSWLSSASTRPQSLEVHDSPWVTELCGLRVLLAHGDDVDPSLVTTVTRRLFRSRVATRLYALLPERVGTHLAIAVARVSRLRGEREDLRAALERRAADLLRSGFGIVILAHIHQPMLKQLGSGWYVNTGDWMSHFSYAELDQVGIRLKRYYVPGIEHRSEKSRSA